MHHWLATNSSPTRINVVWLAMLPSDDRDAANHAMTMFRDPRVAQFWDPKRLSGTRWSVEFQVEPARAALDSFALDDELRPRVEAWVADPASIAMWDVAYFYPRGARWRDRVPRPSAWTKQIGFWLADEDSIGEARSVDPDRVTGQFWCDRRTYGSTESDWFREFGTGMAAIRAR